MIEVSYLTNKYDKNLTFVDQKARMLIGGTLEKCKQETYDIVNRPQIFAFELLKRN